MGHIFRGSNLIQTGKHIVITIQRKAEGAGRISQITVHFRFFFGKPDENTQIYESNTYIKEYTYLGIVGDMNEEGLYNIEQRNKFSVGEQIEVMKPDGENIQVTVRRITDDKGKDMESCPHPKQQLYIDLGVKLDRYDILRRKED